MRLALLLFPLLALPLAAQDARSVEHFEKHVRPLLIAQCLECHGAEGKKIKGGLRLTSRAELLQGGDTGPALVPGKPETSLLIQAIHYQAEGLKMPPKGKLSPSEIGHLETWVKDGAAWPDAINPKKELVPTGALFTEEQKRFWAFQPVIEPKIPDVKDRDWPRSTIDAFILHKLEAQQRRPTAKADKHTLLRRVTFDLIGLPPTPTEIAAFIEDDSPDAFERVVNRLLASPAYGERWARHWLDIARYADSNGLDENTAFGNAWRYRDYVIRSFNDDKPYDRFLKEQLAGDLLPDAASNRDGRTATGFLALGPKLLAEPDKQKMKLDIADEQLDTVGKAMLGLTLGCARCHDHKFDPIPQRDYYSLLSIFTSTRTMKNLATVAQAHERSLPTGENPDVTRDREKKIAAKEADIAKITEEFRAKLRSDARTRFAEYLLATVDPTRKKSLIPELVAALSAFVKNDSLFAPWREVIAGRNVSEVAKSVGDKAPPGLFDAPVPDSRDQLAERYAKIIPAKLFNDTKGPFSLKALPTNLELPYPMETARLSQATAELVALQKSGPPIIMVLGVEEGAQYPQVKADGRPRNLFVQVRGNYLTPGEEAPAVFPRIFTGEKASPFTISANDPLPIAKSETRYGSSRPASGRLELANWIANPEHPLTARVLVNRVWQHHFGEGLVRSPDNFGKLGERPTHPELLDYLARRFVDGGWLIKHLHKLILLSATYQQATRTPTSDDPENRLLAGISRRRLEAEPIRDALLAVAGNLDATMGGSLLNNGNFTYVTNDAATNAARYEQPRRSIYLPVIRNNVFDMFQVFDFAEPHVPNGQRASTIIAPQALYLMNSPFVKRQASLFAAALAGSDDDRVRQAYLRAYARPATAAEIERALDYLSRYAAASHRDAAWTSWCQALLAANEFAYVN